MSRLLVVEDETNVGSTLVERLEREGYQIRWAMDLKTATQFFDEGEFDLAILDVGLPDGTGYDLANIFRQKRPNMAIMFLTAFGGPEDRVKGLELGAEDYVTKPFYLKELLLRISNILKRADRLKSGDDSTVQIGRASVSFPKFEAHVDGRTIRLTHKECALLKVLVKKRGMAVSRDEILDEVWSHDEFPTPRTVDNFVSRLRKLVENDPEHSEVIRSVRGVGYQLQ